MVTTRQPLRQMKVICTNPESSQWTFRPDMAEISAIAYRYECARLLAGCASMRSCSGSAIRCKWTNSNEFVQRNVVRRPSGEFCWASGVTVSRPVSGILSARLPRPGDHPSVRSTRELLRIPERANHSCSLLDLAPSGVGRADEVTFDTGALLPHRFTLT